MRTLGAKRERQYRDLQVLANRVAVRGHAYRRRFQHGEPPDLFHAVADAPLVGRGGGAVLDQQCLGHAAVDVRARRERERRNGIERRHAASSASTMRNATTSKSSMPENSPASA